MAVVVDVEEEDGAVLSGLAWSSISRELFGFNFLIKDVAIPPITMNILLENKEITFVHRSDLHWPVV